MASAGQDEQQQTESGDDLAEHLRGAAALVAGRRKGGQTEHHMSDQDSRECGDDLRGHVRDRGAPLDAPLQQFGQRHERIEVCAGDGPQHGDECVEDGAGGDGIRQQRDRGIALSEPLAHDSRTRHGGQQQGGADELGRQLFTQKHQVLPISRNFSWVVTWSSFSSGRLVRMRMRACNWV